MNGAGKKVWGYYPTTDTWIPLQVDENGKVVVDMSGISLGDLGDTWLPAPGDQYFLYWDDAAGKWDCRILVDADIPASIARDAEVDDKIAAHHDSIIKDADADTYLWVEKTADEDKIHGVVKGVEAFLLNDAGILTLAKQSSCKIESDVEQAVANATWTVVQFNSDAYDIQDESDLANNRITIKVSGTYLVLSGAAIYSVPDGTEVISEIQLDGNTIGDGRIQASKATNLLATGAAITYAAAGSHFTARVRQDSGSSKNLSQYPSQNFLAIFKLG